MKTPRESFLEIVERVKRDDFTGVFRPEYLEDLPEGPRMVPSRGVPISDTQEFIMREFVPRIRFEDCTKCGVCWVFCPLGVISLDAEGFPVIDEQFCRPCGVCVNECPPECIVMVRADAAPEQQNQE